MSKGQTSTSIWLCRACSLFVASFLVNCSCIEHPLYTAATNRWHGYYMGGGDSQYRPFSPNGIRSLSMAEPALLEIETTSDGVVLHTWLGDSAKIIDAQVQWTRASDRIESTKLVIDNANHAQVALDWPQLQQLAEQSLALVFVLTDEAGVQARARFSAQDAEEQIALRELVSADAKTSAERENE